MKGLLLVFLVISVKTFSQGAAIPVQYKLSWLDKKIHVELLYYPVEKDSSVFTNGNLDYGGQKDILKGVQHMEVQAPATVNIDTSKWTFTYIHQSSGPLHISYDIADTHS